MTQARRDELIAIRVRLEEIRAANLLNVPIVEIISGMIACIDDELA